MPEVRPFRGIRYAPSAGSPADLVCAPYDVITPEAQAAYYARSPRNAIRLELGRDEPGDGAARNRYTRAAQQLREWLSAGVLQVESEASLYVYDESFAWADRPLRRRSFFAAVTLEEWDRRVILPHERTLPKPRADRLSLLRATRTNLSPILVLYDDPTRRIAAALESASVAPPVAEFALPAGAVAAAASGHRLWRLDDPGAIQAVQCELAERPLFIADGHHRYETALEYWREARRAGATADDPASRMLMLLADAADPGLLVLPTHRLVRAPGLDRPALLRALRDEFAVEEIDGADDRERLARLLAEMDRRAASAHAFGVAGLATGALHLVSVRPGPGVDALLPADRSPAWRGLDVAVLHGAILERLLGLRGVAAESLAYTRDADEALAAVRSGQRDLAFLLNPTRVDQIRGVALAGERMPEKSTYFWPKPPTGLVFYSHEVG